MGLPALRVPGLFLAVTTLAFAIFMQNAVLATPCFTVPGIGQHPVHRPAQSRPTRWWRARRSSGSSLSSQRAFAWFALGVLLLVGVHGARLA